MIDLQALGLTDWMIDTFIYTALLIGVVLLIRRPVTQYFGPQIAYALWALPLMRLVMPPIVLPAWMAPAEPAPEVAAPTADPLMVFISDAPPAAGAVAAEAAVAAPSVGISVGDLLFPLWLIGAAIFLGWRIHAYVQMRKDLLSDARPVGEAGKVRLVETSAVSAPVAFGVTDKVVALPLDFMALLDVKARDMAIAHELEHHRGHDLLANIAAQPLLALHWFNPLAWWGWRAMRRDQEAACDARVVAGCARSERAAYAEVIAGFAAGEHLALAAPMACPVLGEKSIIHRLRSLTLTDISTRRRRIGIAAITTTALALPLTASITYAQPPVQDQDAETTIETIDPSAEAPTTTNVQTRVIRLQRSGEGQDDVDGEYEIELDEAVDGERIIIRTVEAGDGESHVIRRVIRRGEGGEDTVLDEAELDRIMAEVETRLEGLDGEIEQRIHIAMGEGNWSDVEGNVFVLEERDIGAHRLSVDCDGDQHVVREELEDGRRAMVICQTAIHASAAEGLRGALSSIANNPDIPAEAREEIIRELEETIEELEEMSREGEQVSFRLAPQNMTAKLNRAATQASQRAATAAYSWTGSRAPVASIRFTTGRGQAMQRVPMLNPLTGAPLAPAVHVEDDCEEPRSTRA